MQCHSVSIISHQLELSVFPITTSNIEGISERCCLIDVSMCGMFNRLRKTVTKMSRISGQMTFLHEKINQYLTDINQCLTDIFKI